VPGAPKSAIFNFKNKNKKNSRLNFLHVFDHIPYRSSCTGKKPDAPSLTDWKLFRKLGALGFSLYCANNLLKKINFFIIFFIIQIIQGKNRMRQVCGTQFLVRQTYGSQL